MRHQLRNQACSRTVLRSCGRSHTVQLISARVTVQVNWPYATSALWTAVGLLLIFASVKVTAGRARRLQELVELRTWELNEANQALRRQSLTGPLWAGQGAGWPLLLLLATKDDRIWPNIFRVCMKIESVYDDLPVRLQGQAPDDVLVAEVRRDEASCAEAPVKGAVGIQAAQGKVEICLVDAAAERPDVPNYYLKKGVDVVAYSGGKCLRGPQCSGLALGRRDLLWAAWLNRHVSLRFSFGVHQAAEFFSGIFRVGHNASETNSSTKPLTSA